jgi:hypothetical protein
MEHRHIKANKPQATATREAMSDARLPLAYRDGCAGLLIPLNRCRYEEYYLPWKCEVWLRSLFFLFGRGVWIWVGGGRIGGEAD